MIRFFASQYHYNVPLIDMQTMKTFAVIFLFLLMASSLMAQPEIVLTSRVDQVTVFPSAAQISRSSAFQLNKGVSQLIFDGISPYILSSTIQASGKGEFVILDVKYRVKQPDPITPEDKPVPPAIQHKINALTDSLSQMQFDFEHLQSRKDVLVLEKNVLIGNKYMKGQLDTISQLQFAMEYLRKQLDNINQSWIALKRDEYYMTRKRDDMQVRLNVLQAWNQHLNPVIQESPKHQVVVTVSSATSMSARLSITYLTRQAGWTPQYDLRASGQEQSIQLVCKANVFQNTGEDWNEIMLNLSTITPSQGYSKPKLNPMYAGYYRLAPAPAMNYISGVEVTSINRTKQGSKRNDAAEEDALSSAYFTQENLTLTNVEYEIKLPYSIPSDGQGRMVAIMDKKLNAEFFHFLVPRLDKQAFLLARVIDWKQLDLLPGQANIYFDGNYVGETHISTAAVSDTLDIALGKDRSVIAVREKEKDEVRNAVFGNNVTRTISYKIVVKNNKSAGIHVIIEDQIPITHATDIKIKPLTLSSAEYLESTGILNWKIKLNPKEEKSLIFSYSIEYDKSKPLANIY